MQIRADAKTNRTRNKQLIKNTRRKSSYPINHQVKWSKKPPFAKTVKKPQEFFGKILWNW